MKALEQRILKEGVVLPGNVLKVGSFLNVQIDPAFTAQMGKDIANAFAGDGVTKVLTIETSGIPLAYATGYALGTPVVFAKKSRTANLSGGAYTARVHSYTHNERNGCVLVLLQF